jgi:hypothetical protein
MHTRRFMAGLMTGALAFMAASTFAQEVVVTGPPPALRKNLDAFQKAFNSGDAAQYEAMAKTTFTDSYFKGQTADDRKKAYTKWHAAFGSIKFEQVERNGPDAPLQIFFKGTVASGVMWMELGDASKIAGIKVEGEKK